MLNIFRRRLKNKRKPTVEENLNAYLGVSEALIALGFFGYAIKSKLNLDTYYGEADFAARRVFEADFWPQTLNLITGEWKLLLFSLFLFGWFFLYRNAVKHELTVLSRLYPKTNPPDDWEKIANPKTVPLLAVGLTLAFVGLAWTIDALPVFCIFMMGLSVQDAIGNNILRETIVRHFLRPQFDAEAAQEITPFVAERRQVALNYWVWKPQLARIGYMLIGTVLAFLVATSEQVFGYSFPDYLPNVMIMGIIFANEVTMDKWRRERDLALEDIDEREARAEHETSD